jgi:predicted permease
MTLRHRLISIVRWLARRDRAEQDLNDELQAFVDMAAADEARDGATPAEARRRAVLRLGGVEQVKERIRTGRHGAWLDAFGGDVRYGLRQVGRNPAFSAISIATLALGIGANTAIFQLLDAVRLRMLPVRAPHELAEVRLADMKGARGGFGRSPSVTNRIWEQIRERQQAFSNISAWGTDNNVNLAPSGEVRLARMLYVSGDIFNTLGVQAALGRLFTTADDERGCGAAGLVISHQFWQSEFGGEANVIGRKFTLAERQFEIIGVTPASFFGMEVGRSFDLALPLCAAALADRSNWLDSGTMWVFTVTGRLKPGWSLEQATAQLQAISSGIFETTLPANYPPISVKDYLASRLIAVPAGAGVSRLRENYEQSLWLLLAIAGSVLLIACANLANLLLARASARQREIAVRQALGASRGRLIRQLLVESLLLAATGAALGAGLAQALSRFLVAFLSTSNNPIFLDLTPDWRVLGFAAGLTVLTCLLFGLAPAIRATRIEPGAAIKAGGRGVTAGRERLSLRRGLTVAQVALSLVLIAGAILFSRSLNKLMSVETGFRQEGILTANVGVRRLNFTRESYPAFRDELHDRMLAIPGVEAVSIGGPPLGAGSGTIWMDGHEARQGVRASLTGIGPDYFKTFEIRLLAGREFEARDQFGAPEVAIVNEAFARRFLNGANPVGQRFWTEAFGDIPKRRFEIVGFVRDIKFGDLREEFRPIIFMNRAQDPNASPGDNYSIRSRLSQTETIAAVKRLLSEINPAITVSFQSFKPLIEATILRERLVATLSGFFGLLALVLASIGIYGILSYGVASRTHEIGIRMALGAERRGVLWLILREALVLVTVGVIVGMPLIFAVTRLAASLLFSLSPTDPVSLLLAVLLMVGVALVAGYLPSRRATKVDPMVALGCE